MSKSLLIILFLTGGLLFAAGPPIGVFEANTDVGVTPLAGSAKFDAATGEYRVTGGGANMWKDADAFQFVWKKMSGDMAITADIRLVGAGKVAHRKAALMIRQSLDPNSAYADVAAHGDGLTALQFRPAAGAMTDQIVSELKGAVRLRIERRGNQFTMLAGNPGEPLKPAGPATVVTQDPVYVGLAMCSHDVTVLETAVFWNVKVEPLPRPQAQGGRAPSRSKISIYDLRSKSVEVIFTDDKVWEAPNWSPDGRFLMVNSGGNLYRLAPRKGAQPEKVDLGSITGCNNDHGISPDGKLIVFSARANAPASQVFLANADGSNPRLLTPKSPSYYHTWSPDGKWLVFTGQREENFDLYRLPVTGGEEQRLTSNPGLDDGPDYSPDGQWIYFNSNRTGNFDIWRIPAGGAGKDDPQAEQVTSDEWEDWFPHPSPDGKWMVFVSFEKGTQGHPANQNVVLRMMPLPGAKLAPAKIEGLTKLFGGQGTINVNSWSPDSRRFAFVSYELLKPAGPK